MGAFEYLLLFTAIILGLAVTDLAVSLHRLLGAGDRVRWDWLAPLAALAAFLKIVTQWWSWHAAEQLAGAVTFEMFLGLLAGSVLLFLLAAAALPDDARPDGVVELAAHYAHVRRRYWILFLAQWLVGNLTSVWNPGRRDPRALRSAAANLSGRPAHRLDDGDPEPMVADGRPSRVDRHLPDPVLRPDPQLEVALRGRLGAFGRQQLQLGRYSAARREPAGLAARGGPPMAGHHDRPGSLPQRLADVAGEPGLLEASVRDAGDRTP